jgi:hypothetical protein
MTSGSYQLELRGSDGNSFTLTTRTVSGDANDGYSEAKMLTRQSTRVGTLDIDDQADYYTFSIATPGNYMVETSNSEHVRCAVVPLADVDMFGFASPTCNASFAYTIGTYVVVIDRKSSETWQQTSYGVVLKPLLK